MTRFFTLAVAAALAGGISTNAWSQGGQSGAGSGSAGASGSAGTSGSAADANAAGAAGTTAAGQTGATAAGQGGTTAAGQGGTTAAGQGGTTAPGQTGSQIGTGRQNPSNVPGQRQFGPTPTPGANFNGVAQTPWFTDPGARRQLNMNDQQFNTLNRAYMDAWSRYNLGVTNLGANLTPQQRMQQMQQLEARFNQEIGQSLDSTFTDPRHRQRFNQLNWQFDNFRAFNDPNIRQQLNLTPQQQRQLRRLQNAWRQRMQQLRRAGNENSQLTEEQWAQLQAQNMQQINAVMTPQQQQVWSQAVGQPYNFPPSVYQLGGPGNQGNQPFQGVQKPGPDVSPGPEATRPPAQSQRPSVQPQPRNNQGQGQSTQGGTVR